jgi:hypothetical protein
VHAGHPVPAVFGWWPNPRIAKQLVRAQGVHVGPVLVYSCACLISVAGGPVAGDDYLDISRHALEESESGEVPPRCRGFACLTLVWHPWLSPWTTSVGRLMLVRSSQKSVRGDHRAADTNLVAARI